MALDLRSPFPGMDPFLEGSENWSSLHALLMAGIAAQLQPQLLPRYYARIEQRVVLTPTDQERYPDVAIHETPGGSGTAVAVRPLARNVAKPEVIAAPELERPHREIVIRTVSERKAVTVIEVLSPWNKRGRGRTEYRAKQSELLRSESSLVEIDLLRGGRHTVAVAEEDTLPADYRICIHRASRPQFELVRFDVRDPLPSIGIPLLPPDPDVVLDLGEAFARSYVEGAFAMDLDESRSPDPPLSPDDAEWARERIAAWRNQHAQ